MKIALLGTRGIPASCSGFETCVEQLGQRLVERGHKVVAGWDWKREKWPAFARQYIQFAKYLATKLPNACLTDSRSGSTR